MTRWSEMRCHWMKSFIDQGHSQDNQEQRRNKRTDFFIIGWYISMDSHVFEMNLSNTPEQSWLSSLFPVIFYSLFRKSLHLIAILVLLSDVRLTNTERKERERLRFSLVLAIVCREREKSNNPKQLEKRHTRFSDGKKDRFDSLQVLHACLLSTNIMIYSTAGKNNDSSRHWMETLERKWFDWSLNQQIDEEGSIDNDRSYSIRYVYKDLLTDKRDKEEESREKIWTHLLLIKSKH